MILKDGNGHGHGANDGGSGDDDRVKHIRNTAMIYHMFLLVCNKGPLTKKGMIAHYRSYIQG